MLLDNPFIKINGQLYLRSNPKKRLTNRSHRLQSLHVFDDRNIASILNATRTHQIINYYIKLRKCKNGDWTGNCPLCNKDRKSVKNVTSLRINKKNDIFKCFCCGNSGNGIKFLQLLKNIPFDKAITEINNIFFDGIKELKIIKLKKQRKFKSNYDKWIEETQKANVSVISDEDDDLPF